MEPLATSPRLTLDTPCRTYKFIPTGGVNNPISPTITKTTPNQNGSKPRFVITGNTAGPIDAHTPEDARLIAAAPELKEAGADLLRILDAWLLYYGPPTDEVQAAMDRLRGALAGLE